MKIVIEIDSEDEAIRLVEAIIALLSDVEIKNKRPTDFELENISAVSETISQLPIFFRIKS